MQLLIAVVTLLAISFLGAVICFGYPSVIKRISLSLYRHAISAEKMHVEKAAKLNEDWMRMLE